MNNEKTGHCITCFVQKACMALVWFQTMIWSFVLVGAAGLSVYCWFENPEPWASIAQIWAVAGGLTLVTLVLSLLLTGMASVARKVERLSVRNSMIVQ